MELVTGEASDGWGLVTGGASDGWGLVRIEIVYHCFIPLSEVILLHTVEPDLKNVPYC